MYNRKISNNNKFIRTERNKDQTTAEKNKLSVIIFRVNFYCDIIVAYI